MAQSSLFDALPPAGDLKRERLMAVLDTINRMQGRESSGIGSTGVHSAGLHSQRMGEMRPFRATFPPDLADAEVTVLIKSPQATSRNLRS